MTAFFLSLLCWAACGLICYFLVRRDYRKSLGKWTQIDRIYWLAFSLAYGAIMLLVVIIAFIGMKISGTEWAKREAQW
jgi:hypothetical protein